MLAQRLYFCSTGRSSASRSNTVLLVVDFYRCTCTRSRALVTSRQDREPAFLLCLRLLRFLSYLSFFRQVERSVVLSGRHLVFLLSIILCSNSSYLEYRCWLDPTVQPPLGLHARLQSCSVVLSPLLQEHVDKKASPARLQTQLLGVC